MDLHLHTAELRYPTGLKYPIADSAIHTDGWSPPITWAVDTSYWDTDHEGCERRRSHGTQGPYSIHNHFFCHSPRGPRGHIEKHNLLYSKMITASTIFYERCCQFILFSHFRLSELSRDALISSVYPLSPIRKWIAQRTIATCRRRGGPPTGARDELPRP